ncbi:MFS family permease [Sphingomonas sanguinis]
MRLNRATIVRRLSPNRSTARDGTRALRFMAGAQITGALGSAFTRFGINLWIYNHTESISLFLVLNIAGALPSVVAAPFASYLLYRVPLRTLILLGNVAVMIGPAAIFLVALTGHHVVELGVATVLLSALVDTFAWPALSAVITLLADGREEERTRINGWLESGDAASGIAGPVLGAFLYSIGGVPLLCGLDVLTVGVAIVATLIAVPLIPRPVGLARRRVSPVRVLVADARWVFDRPPMRRLLLLFAVCNGFLAVGAAVSTPFFLSFMTPRAFGIVETAGAAGLFVAGISVGALKWPEKPAERILLGWGSIAACLLAVSISVRFTPAIVVIQFVLFASIGFVNIASQGLWQSITPLHRQARVFVVRRMIARSTIPVFLAAAAPISDHIVVPFWRWLYREAASPSLWHSANETVQATLIFGCGLAIAAALIVFAPGLVRSFGRARLDTLNKGMP